MNARSPCLVRRHPDSCVGAALARSTGRAVAAATCCSTSSLSCALMRSRVLSWPADEGPTEAEMLVAWEERSCAQTACAFAESSSAALAACTSSTRLLVGGWAADEALAFGLAVGGLVVLFAAAVLLAAAGGFAWPPKSVSCGMVRTCSTNN